VKALILAASSCRIGKKRLHFLEVEVTNLLAHLFVKVAYLDQETGKGPFGRRIIRTPLYSTKNFKNLSKKTSLCISEDNADKLFLLLI